ncbi:MarR family winged helix-turn-helix transcriptional regulator [Acinetobacter rudis]|uniref:MarR family transcriptional regulator n=1 Tax=Acinetobacter rudis TaxID=632955 RepID=A0AAW8JAF3_9GAMM|nr:MarR family transcriptional regulator [Acinetobacter rudis]MDQ8936770.1 MarR family transcriptional regulator [Acinetobacter rudis]MDQ9018991.1 MarR family transcriptional regulator [Acinetobacter rudis]
MSKIDFLITHVHLGSLVTKKFDLRLSTHGINFTEFMLMYHLNAAQNQTLSRIALADKVALSASGVTRVLQPMEKIGLTERHSNPRDARQSLVSLSKTGQGIFQDALVSVEETANDIQSLLSTDEIATLMHILQKLKL